MPDHGRIALAGTAQGRLTAHPKVFSSLTAAFISHLPHSFFQILAVGPTLCGSARVMSQSEAGSSARLFELANNVLQLVFFAAWWEWSGDWPLKVMVAASMIILQIMHVHLETTTIRQTEDLIGRSRLLTRNSYVEKRKTEEEYQRSVPELERVFNAAAEERLPFNPVLASLLLIPLHLGLGYLAARFII